MTPSLTSDARGVQILSEGAGFAPLTGHTVLRVTGADRAEFVHGQLSNEVKRLAVGEFNTSLLLNHKGHALAQLHVLRKEDELLLVVEGARGERVRAQLEQHIIFDQVELGTLPSWHGVTVQGPQAARALNTFDLPEAGHFGEANGVFIFPTNRSSAGGYDLISERSKVEPESRVEPESISTAEQVSEAALLAARIAAGIPLAHSEAGEGVLPQEAGLEPYVSYTKGCYLGQEIMARIEARGSLKRALSGLRLDAVPDSEDITLHGKKVGRLGSYAEHPEHGLIALAVLRSGLENDTLNIGNAHAKVTPLPFE